MSTKDEQILEAARRLVRRSIIGGDEERGIMRRAALIILRANGRALNVDDIKVVAFARTTWGRDLEEEPGPPAPSPYDDEITAAEARVDEKKSALEEDRREKVSGRAGGARRRTGWRATWCSTGASWGERSGTPGSEDMVETVNQVTR